MPEQLVNLVRRRVSHRVRHVERRRPARRGHRKRFDQEVALGADRILGRKFDIIRSEEHTSELQSLMRISYAVFCLNKKPSNLLPTTPSSQSPSNLQHFFIILQYLQLTRYT